LELKPKIPKQKIEEKEKESSRQNIKKSLPDRGPLAQSNKTAHQEPGQHTVSVSHR
jgi:hypothetical protein